MTQGQIQLPQPTGSYNVGLTTHFVLDTSRTYTNAPGRPLLVHIYYPTTETQKEYPAYLADTMHLYKQKILATYNVTPQDIAYLDAIKDWATPDAPIATENSPFPVLFFSPGFLMAAQLYSSVLEEMASHGYVVVAINHTDACWPVLFPDGTSPLVLPELVHIFSNKQTYLQTFDATQTTWVKDIEFVLAWLHNQPIKQYLDLARLGIFGHSFGGSVAAEIARQNNIFKAVATMDSMFFGPHWNQPLQTPSLFIAAEKLLTHQEAVRAGLTIEQCDTMLARHAKNIFDPSQDNSLYVTVKDADHASFVDSKLIKSPLSKERSTSAESIKTTRTLLVNFFDRYLNNTTAS